MGLIIMGMVLPLLTGCIAFPAEGDPTQKSNLTSGMVKKEIIKGKTTQAEVLELFGSPNLVTKNRDNDEVWNYNRMSYETKAGADGVGIIFWRGSRAMTTTTTKSFDLILIFNKNDIVKDYSVISAQY